MFTFFIISFLYALQTPSQLKQVSLFSQMKIPDIAEPTFGQSIMQSVLALKNGYVPAMYEWYYFTGIHRVVTLAVLFNDIPNFPIKNLQGLFDYLDKFPYIGRLSFRLFIMSKILHENKSFVTPLFKSLFNKNISSDEFIFFIKRHFILFIINELPYERLPDKLLTDCYDSYYKKIDTIKEMEIHDLYAIKPLLECIENNHLNNNKDNTIESNSQLESLLNFCYLLINNNPDIKLLLNHYSLTEVFVYTNIFDSFLKKHLSKQIINLLLQLSLSKPNLFCTFIMHLKLHSYKQGSNRDINQHFLTFLFSNQLNNSFLGFHLRNSPLYADILPPLLPPSLTSLEYLYLSLESYQQLSHIQLRNFLLHYISLPSVSLKHIPAAWLNKLFVKDHIFILENINTSFTLKNYLTCIESFPYKECKLGNRLLKKVWDILMVSYRKGDIFKPYFFIRFFNVCIWGPENLNNLLLILKKTNLDSQQLNLFSAYVTKQIKQYHYEKEHYTESLEQLIKQLLEFFPFGIGNGSLKNPSIIHWKSSGPDIKYDWQNIQQLCLNFFDNHSDLFASLESQKKFQNYFLYKQPTRHYGFMLEIFMVIINKERDYKWQHIPKEISSLYDFKKERVSMENLIVQLKTRDIEPHYVFSNKTSIQNCYQIPYLLMLNKKELLYLTADYINNLEDYNRCLFENPDSKNELPYVIFILFHRLSLLFNPPCEVIDSIEQQEITSEPFSQLPIKKENIKNITLYNRSVLILDKYDQEWVLKFQKNNEQDNEFKWNMVWESLQKFMPAHLKEKLPDSCGYYSYENIAETSSLLEESDIKTLLETYVLEEQGKVQLMKCQGYFDYIECADCVYYNKEPVAISPLYKEIVEALAISAKEGIFFREMISLFHDNSSLDRCFIPCPLLFGLHPSLFFKGTIEHQKYLYPNISKQTLLRDADNAVFFNFHQSIQTKLSRGLSINYPELFLPIEQLVALEKLQTIFEMSFVLGRESLPHFLKTYLDLPETFVDIWKEICMKLLPIDELLLQNPGRLFDECISFLPAYINIINMPRYSVRNHDNSDQRAFIQSMLAVMLIILTQEGFTIDWNSVTVHNFFSDDWNPVTVDESFIEQDDNSAVANTRKRKIKSNLSNPQKKRRNDIIEHKHKHNNSTELNSFSSSDSDDVNFLLDDYGSIDTTFASISDNSSLTNSFMFKRSHSLSSFECSSVSRSNIYRMEVSINHAV